MLCFGTITAIAAGLGLLLPEYTGKRLAQNFDDMEEQELERSKCGDETKTSYKDNNKDNKELEKNLLPNGQHHQQNEKLEKSDNIDDDPHVV